MRQPINSKPLEPKFQTFLFRISFQLKLIGGVWKHVDSKQMFGAGASGRKTIHGTNQPAGRQHELVTVTVHDEWRHHIVICVDVIV